MDLSKYNIYNNYYHILNNTIIKNKLFHFLFINVDTIIMLVKILDIYQTNYVNNSKYFTKYLKPSSLLSGYIMIIKLLPIILYLLICYLISILYFFVISAKKTNKFDKILINLLEFFFKKIFK